ncbi:MAG: tripartite tricarboxylate transporter substrate binding protein [Burkholderiales bacterium]
MVGRTMAFRCGSALWFAVGAVCAVPVAAQGWKPQKHVEFIVPAGAGGSMDTAMRTVERAVRELKLPVSTGVINRAGGEHAIAYTYIQQRAGDPHYLSLTSPVLLTNHISGVLPLTYTDVTPIASIMSEYYLFVVSANSKIKTGKDFVEALRQAPESVSVAGGNLPQRMTIGLVLQAADVDIKRVRIVTISGAKTSLSVAGGHVDVGVAAPGQALTLISAGQLRPIATSGPKRLGGSLAQVPTWAELGYKNAEFISTRGVIAPKDLTPQQVAYWEDVLRRATQTEEFKQVADKFEWDVDFRNSAEYTQFLAAEYAKFKRVMGFLGAAK